MNIKSLSAFSSSRIRHAITVSVVGCALVLGVTSAQAGDDKNRFTVFGKAGNTDKDGKGDMDSALTIDVDGEGKFKGSFQGDNLVLEKTNVDMKSRQKHTKEAMDLKDVKITIPKSNLKMPAPGAPASGTAKGTLTLNGKSQEVTIKYEVEDAGDSYKVKSAKFSFNYIKHTKDNKPICVPLIGKPCVMKDITITATNGLIKK